MKILGWLFVVWLIGSIIYSIGFTARGYSGMKASGDQLGMANRWGGRMLMIQLVKAIVAFFLIVLLLR